MSEKSLPKYISDHLDRISKNNGFNNYSIQVNSGSNLGDGFASNILSVKITENNNKNVLHLVCKLARKEFFPDLLFAREAAFYNEIMPTFAKFQEEKHLSEGDQFRSYPKCYAAICDSEKVEYVIILEDLRACGFKMWNKGEIASIELLRLMMSEIGKFHGISTAMKDQKPEVFAEFQKFSDFIRNLCKSKIVAEDFDDSFDRAITSLKSEDHKDIMRHIKNNITSYFEYLLTENNRFAVISHGDLWINNLLTRFNDKNITEEIRFIDWQMTEYVSPVIDLCFSLFTCTDKAIRDKEYDNLIKLYYESLSKTVKLLGSDLDKLFTFDDLQDDLKKFGIFALTISSMHITSSLANVSQKESHNNAKDGEKSQEFVFHLNEKAQLEYDRRLNEVFEDVVDKLGYYHKII